MYKRIFKGGYIPDTVESTEEKIRKAVMQSHCIKFMDFDSKEDSEEFAKRFPKYVKVRPYILWGGDRGKYYNVEFRISKCNDVTGEVNETGLRRLDALIKTMKKEGLIK